MLHHALRAQKKGFAPVVHLVTTSGAGSYATPAGAVWVTVEAIGGGGNGYGTTTSSARAGGGGAGYSRTTNLAVTEGTLVYYSVGAAAVSSWVRIGVNTTPSSSTQGCLGRAGGSATASSAGIAGTTSIGEVTYNGAAGAVGSSAVGGGAGGDSAAASGQTGGGSGDMAGGAGGSYGGVAPVPGGGAGAKSTAGAVAGAIGRVRITFY